MYVASMIPNILDITQIEESLWLTQQFQLKIFRAQDILVLEKNFREECSVLKFS